MQHHKAIKTKGLQTRLLPFAHQFNELIHACKKKLKFQLLKVATSRDVSIVYNKKLAMIWSFTIVINDYFYKKKVVRVTSSFFYFRPFLFFSLYKLIEDLILNFLLKK